MRAAAIMLTAAAVAVPCTVWYAAGSRAAVREAHELERAARHEAEGVALRLAERLATRLETIRETESRRPPYHYEPFFHDPESNCACAAITPSPLAAGPSDPLIWTHFQIDPERGVTLPGEPRGAALELAPAAAQIVASTETAPGFEWRTVSIDGRPELVAVRRTATPKGFLVQGLVVNRGAVAEHLRGSSLPAQFLTGDGAEPDRASLPEAWVASPVPIECVTWHVAVDASSSLGAAAARAHEIQRGFHMTFLGGAAAAALAGLCVMGLIWQTDRLARDRAHFAAVAAHELRTPLASLRVYAEMLRDGLGDPARAQEYGRVMAGEAERLGRVVSNVLGYTRLERRALGVNRTAGDLPAEVRHCMDRLAPALATAGARADLEIEAGVPSIAFDRDAVFHILQNLIDNAERYGRGASDRRIHVRLSPADGGRVAIAVSDHGPGVPPAMRQVLFIPFRRGGNGTESSTGSGNGTGAGLGLGLALVRELARAHGGEATFAEAPQGGSTFTVTLAG
jgi:signal transduction histidine kinase